MMNKLFRFGFTSFLLSLTVHVQGATWDDSYNQMNATLTGYDSRHRPVLDQSDSVQVNVSFDLVAIQEFDEVNEKFSVVGVIYITWIDEKLVWNPFLYGGIWSQMYKAKDIWYPVMILANPYVEVADFVEDWMSVRLFPNGYAFFAPGSVFKSTCSVDVTYYPFDTQKCHLLFVAWAYSSSELYFHAAQKIVGRDYYSENGIWELGDTSVSTYVNNDLSFMKIDFKLKRKPLFLVINVLLPIVFMSIINILVFMLPPESGERVSYAITVLLAIAVFLTLVGDNIPKTSKPMSVLCYFLMIELILSTSMCVAAILNLRLYHKKPAVSVPNWCKYLTRLLNCNIKINCVKSTGRPETKQTLRKREIQPFNSKFKVDKREVTPIEVFNIEDEEPSKWNIVTVDTTVEVSWKEVSQAVDKICIALFVLAMAITDGIFLTMLVNNTKSV